MKKNADLSPYMQEMLTLCDEIQFKHPDNDEYLRKAYNICDKLLNYGFAANFTNEEKQIIWENTASLMNDKHISLSLIKDKIEAMLAGKNPFENKEIPDLTIPLSKRRHPVLFPLYNLYYKIIDCKYILERILLAFFLSVLLLSFLKFGYVRNLNYLFRNITDYFCESIGFAIIFIGLSIVFDKYTIRIIKYIKDNYLNICVTLIVLRLFIR